MASHSDTLFEMVVDACERRGVDMGATTISWEPNDRRAALDPSSLLGLVRFYQHEWGGADVILDSLLMGLSNDLAKATIEASLRGAEHIPHDEERALEPAIQGDDPALLFCSETSRIGWCPSCKMARVESVASIAVGGRHIPVFCESCGSRLAIGRASRDIVVNVNGQCLFESLEEHPCPASDESVSHLLIPDATLAGPGSTKRAMEEYEHMGGLTPAHAWQVISGSPLVDWENCDIEELLVNPHTLRLEGGEFRDCNTRARVRIEAGAGRVEGYAVHDPRLDVGGDTLAHALSNLAMRCLLYAP